MVYLVVNIIKLSYESLYITANDHFGDHGMLYRSKIGDDVEEISHTCYLRFETARWATAMNLVVWVLWGEIKVDFNDVKHIVHLIRRFHGLGNTIMTCFHDYHQFYGLK